jgi:hypothetical protein
VAAFPSCVRSTLTEIYLCHACSCHEVVSGNAAAGGAGPSGWRGVIANWTLHFIVSREERRRYVVDVFEKLTPGGVFVLTEKTQQDDIQQSEYHQWKQQQGLSDMEVEAKAERIKGVLCPLPASWYDSALAQAGFVDVELASNHFEFRTWVARKPPAPSAVVSSDPVAAARPFVAWPTLGVSVAFDGSDDPIAPYAVRGWDDGGLVSEQDDASVYGIVVEGTARLIPGGHTGGGFELARGYYFACPVSKSPRPTDNHASPQLTTTPRPN